MTFWQKTVRQPFDLDVMQGASEQQTEMYLTYIEGVAQFATQQYTKSFSGATCSAGWQTEVVGRLS